MMKYLIYSLLVLVTVLVFACDKGDEDKTPPVITLLGDSSMPWQRDTVWVDPGYIAKDEEDGDITSKVIITDKPDVSVDGDYFVKYNVIDKAGNQAEEQVRKVKVMIF